MRERDPALPTTRQPRASLRRSSHSIDVIVLTPRGRQLSVLCLRATDPRARERWHLPSDRSVADEGMEATARRLVHDATGVDPTWLEQVGAFADAAEPTLTPQSGHPAESELSVAYAAVIPKAEDRSSGEQAWFVVHEPPVLPPRQRVMLEAALAAIRQRVDYAPIAFRLLPELFTLSELQRMYELLLGRRLHKASFRRALAAAQLVTPTDEWRSEGRGRPAQYYRFTPRASGAAARSVRFDLL